MVSHHEAITVEIQPEAALSLLRTLHWGETDSAVLRELSHCAENEEPITWEVERDG